VVSTQHLGIQCGMAGSSDIKSTDSILYTRHAVLQHVIIKVLLQCMLGITTCVSQSHRNFG
jgi:hypothetical protein